MSVSSLFFASRTANRFDKTRWVVLLTIIAIVPTGQTLAQGQNPNRNSYTREQTKELIDDYSNSLRDRDDYGDNNRRSQPPAAGITTTISPEMKQARPLIRDFSDAAAQLTYAMNDQISRVPALRSLYSDTLTISAEAVGLNRKAGAANDHHALLDDFGQLDADWREMAYRLQGVRGITPEIRDLAANLNDLDQQIRKALNTQPQLNREDVALVAAGIAGDLQNLMEDIKAELGRTQAAQQLLIQTSRARQQALSLVSICQDDGADAGTLVREYRQFEGVWSPLANKLQAEENRYVQRNLRRISQSNSRMHQLLLLPVATDKSQLLFLTSTLKKDIDEYFSSTPLSLVIELPNSQRALQTAQQFYAACQHFVDQVKQGADHNALIDSFRSIEEAQRGFDEVYGQMNSKDAAAVLQRIDQTIGTIRMSLHLERDDFDRGSAGELVASIENLTINLDTITKQWLASDPQSFSEACRQETAAMVHQAETIHHDMVKGIPVAQLRRQVDDLYERWRTVYKYIVKCQTNDRAILGRLSSRLTPAMVELRSLVAPSSVEQATQQSIRR